MENIVFIISFLESAEAGQIILRCWGGLFHREKYLITRNVFLSAALDIQNETKCVASQFEELSLTRRAEKQILYHYSCEKGLV